MTEAGAGAAGAAGGWPLPRFGSRPAPGPVPSPRLHPMPDGRAAILIVDDRPDKLLALEAVLEDLGERIVRAYSGREALRHVLEQEFAVILLDVNMPGMDGFETAALIRQRKSSENVPIIFVTAFGDEMHATRGY